MSKFIEFLKLVNKQTNGLFFVFSYVIFLLVISCILFLNDLCLIPFREDMILGLVLLTYCTNFVFNSIFTSLIVIICFVVFKIIKWVFVDLFSAIKSALKEVYSNNIEGN